MINHCFCVCLCFKVSISTVVCLVIAASTSSHSVRNPSYPSYPDPRDFYSSGNDASSPFEQSSPTDEPLEEYHEPENNGGWQGWRGIPIPLHPTSRYHNRNVHKEIVTTSRPVVKDLYYPTEDHTSDQWTKEVPTQQSRYGWQPKKYIPVHLARQRVIVKPTRRYHSTRAPEKLSTNGHQMSAHLQQPSDFGQKPTSLDERPFYEPSQFWNPGNQGMDILVNDPPGNRDEGEGRDMEELSDDQPQPLPPLRQPARDHHQPRMIQEGRGRELRGSESRAQGVIVTGKDLEAEAGQFLHYYHYHCYSFFILIRTVLTTHSFKLPSLLFPDQTHFTLYAYSSSLQCPIIVFASLTTTTITPIIIFPFLHHLFFWFAKLKDTIREVTMDSFSKLQQCSVHPSTPLSTLSSHQKNQLSAISDSLQNCSFPSFSLNETSHSFKSSLHHPSTLTQSEFCSKSEDKKEWNHAIYFSQLFFSVTSFPFQLFPLIPLRFPLLDSIS